MILMLDTNAYRSFAEGDREVVEILQVADEILVPFIVLAELRAGFACGGKGRANEALLVRFLNSPRVRVVFPTEDTTNQYAYLYLQLRKQGTPIPTNDLWIAALATQRRAILCSRDRHFEHLPQIPRAL